MVVARLAIERGGEKERREKREEEERKGRRRTQGRRTIRATTSSTTRSLKGMREQKSPRAWVKTARRWDIIGRGIGMGWFRCSPSCVAKAPTSLPPRACNHENFGNEEPHGNGHGKGGEGDHPLNGLANHAKPEIGSDFGGFAADRGRL